MRHWHMSHPVALSCSKPGFNVPPENEATATEAEAMQHSTEHWEQSDQQKQRRIQMKKLAVLCMLALAVAIPVLAVAQDNQSKTVSRDMSGVMDGRFGFEGPWEGPWNVTGDLAGTVSHLGLSAMYTNHMTYASGTIADGTFTIVAANGDEILGTYTASAGYISDDQALGHATLSVTGGTGRFARATGTIHADFLETLDDPTWASAKVTWFLDGKIDY